MHEIPIPSLFTTRQASEAGVSEHRLGTYLHDGVVRRVLQGVYAETGLPDDLVLRVAALRLVVKPWSVVTDRTAAWLHGIDTFSYRELEILPPIDVCVLPDRNRVRRKGAFVAGAETSHPAI